MALHKLPVFAHHSRYWRDNRFVYPVISRRSKGLSIGLNLNPDDVCNFDCIYCCVDRSTPRTGRKFDLAIARDELDRMLAWAKSGEIYTVEPISAAPPPLRRLNDIAFSGNGEPTSCPCFEEACRLVVELLEKHDLPQTKIVTITNATLLHRPAIVRAMEYLDHHHGEIWAKLDAGTEPYYRLVERTAVPFSRVLANIAAAGRIRPIVIQSLFMRINGVGPTPEEVAAYIARLKELIAAGCQIKLVQIYTTARHTAETYVTPLPDADLDAIATGARTTGLNVETYYGVG